MYWLLIGLLILIAVSALVLVPHNLRVWRARRDYRQLPPHVIEQTFSDLETAAQQRTAVTFLRPMHGLPCDDPTGSHIGGLPYAELGDAWPSIDSGPGTFLVQVRLDDPGLGKTWQGRLIQVFLAYDMEQAVCSYASPSATAYVPIQPPADPVKCIPLRHLRLPKYEDSEEAESWSTQLLELVPALQRTLAPFSRDVEGLLAQILCPQVYGYKLTEADEAFVGGEPILIQNPHEPICDVCGKAMRFLFQFGEFIPNVQLADAGVCYVYGCDEHPDSCKSYLDSH